MIEMFVSYCQKDKIYADHIDLYFKNKKVIIHRDVRDIKEWSSIKQYMNSAGKMDYAILVITDNYLKSPNCMYEVLEVMKEHNYKDKIFPVVVENSIYMLEGKLKYVSYWENQFKTLNESMKQVEIVNLGPLHEELKRTQTIASSISEFLGLISDMNNPDISDINEAIENKLIETGLLSDENSISKECSTSSDLFSTLGIPRKGNNTAVTDLQKNQYITDSFKEIIKLLKKLSDEYQNEYNEVDINYEQIDSRTCIYQFYRNGKLVRGIKVFLSSMFGSGSLGIGISDNTYSLGSNNSWNGMYSVNVFNGELKLFATMSLNNSKEAMNEMDVVKDIWTSYVQPYLERR